MQIFYYFRASPRTAHSSKKFRLRYREYRGRSLKAAPRVAILGNGLAGTTNVSCNGTAAAFPVVADTEITVTVPAGATTGKVQGNRLRRQACQKCLVPSDALEKRIARRKMAGRVSCQPFFFTLPQSLAVTAAAVSATTAVEATSTVEPASTTVAVEAAVAAAVEATIARTKSTVAAETIISAEAR